MGTKWGWFVRGILVRQGAEVRPKCGVDVVFGPHLRPPSSAPLPAGGESFWAGIGQSFFLQLGGCAKKFSQSEGERSDSFVKVFSKVRWSALAPGCSQEISLNLAGLREISRTPLDRTRNFQPGKTP